MIRRDLPQVVAIEAATGESKWSEEEFLARLRVRECVAMVCVDSLDTVLAYMVYEPHPHYLNILNLTVNPKYHRRSVGRHMVDTLQAKLSEHRRTGLEFRVRERNLAAQLFLREMGFECDEIVKGWFCGDDGEEDAYHFVYNLTSC